MLTPELMDRVQLLHADLAQVRQQSQARGSGATIHRVSNQVATAQSILQFVATRCDEASADDIEPPGDVHFPDRLGANQWWLRSTRSRACLRGVCRPPTRAMLVRALLGYSP